jgi:L-ascorbate metabolism protein UlaG (beta-lactamase superfamily)
MIVHPMTRRLALGLLGAAATGPVAQADADRTLHRSIRKHARLLLPASTTTTGLKARFMGTSTLLLDDGTDRILLDGFFSRPSLLRSGMGPVTPDLGRIKSALTRIGNPTIRAVLTAHAHYDHALDAPTVARLTNATLVGSRSVKRIADGHGFKGPFEMLRGRQEMQFGAFRVTSLPTPHSPRALFPGDIEEALPLTSHVRHYREGGCYSFLLQHGETGILITPGANAEPGDLEGVKADVVFLGTGTLGKQDTTFIDQYWHEAVTQTDARVVIPIHWDNFFRSLDEPLRPLPGIADDFEASMAAVETRAGRRRVALMPLFDAVDMPPQVSP